MSVQAATGYPQQSGTFLPTVWSTTLNVKYFEATVIPEITNSNWEDDISNLGDKVEIRQTPDVTIDDYQKGQDISYEDLEEDNVLLEIDRAKHFAFKVDDIDKYQSDIDLLGDWAEDAALRMKIKIDTDYLQSIYTNAGSNMSGNSAGAISGDIVLGTSSVPKSLTGNNIIDYLVDLNICMDETNLPEMYRYVVLPAWACGMVKKSELKDASVTNDQASILRTGYLGMVDRVSIYCSNLLNSSSGKFDVIFGHISGVTFAAQIVDVQYFEKLERTFGSAIRGLNVFGWKAVKTDALGHSVIQKG